MKKISASFVVNLIRKVTGKGSHQLHEPLFFGKEKNYLKNTINQNSVSSTGKYVNLFEKRIKDYTKAKFAIAVVNGTQAIYISLKACGVKRNEEVLVPALTFVGTVNAISYLGAKPHFVDSEINNLRLDTARKIGMDPKEIKDDLFPIESFEKEALNRVTIGVLLNKIIEEKEIKVDPARVKQLVQERASMYKKPEEVVSWFYSNKEQLNSIESISLEEQVIEILLTEAKEIEEELSYEECVSNLNT